MPVTVDALIVVDMQRAFVTGPGAIPDAPRVRAAIDRLISRAREAGSLVVQLQNDGPGGAVDEPGSTGWELIMEPQPGETVLRKREDDGFVGTDLEGLLRNHGVAVLTICGVQSEMCVAATARAALQRKLSVVLPRDAHGTYPVPSDDNGGLAVPADLVARVAEWSLGDEVLVFNSSDDVAFGQHRSCVDKLISMAGNTRQG